MKNKIILVGGYCAAGKTTFSRNLGQKLNIPCFNQDTIDEMICDGFGYESKVFEMGSEKVAFELILHIAEQFMQAGQICIFESVFTLKSIKEIKILFDKYNCECLLFIFKGDVGVLLERYIERDKSGERHWIHHPADNPGGRNWFMNHMSKMYDGLEESEVSQKVVVDATDFEKVNYDELYDIAKKFTKNKKIN